MKKRTLGRGLEVSAIGFGCMGLNFSYGHALSNTESITPHPPGGRPRRNLLRHG